MFGVCCGERTVTNLSNVSGNENLQSSARDEPQLSQHTLDMIAQSSEESPMVVLGPIVGTVSTTTARVLLETAIPCVVTLHARPWLKGPQEVVHTADGRHEGISCKMVLLGLGHPRGGLLKGLTPGTRYTVAITGAVPLEFAPYASFKTLSIERPEVFKIGVVSCNKVYFDSTGRADLWADVAEKSLEGEIDALLHIGDQVYLDSDFYISHDDDPDELEHGMEGNVDEAMSGDKKSKVHLKKGGKEHGAYNTALRMLEPYHEAPFDKDPHDPIWEIKIDEAELEEVKNRVRSIYREVYRSTWCKKSTAKALAAVPNYMVLDDHEITDDWGDREHDKMINFDETVTDKRFVCQCAYEVYCMYQAQLWWHNDDVETLCPKVTEAWIHHKLHDVGIIMLDVRAEKTFLRPVVEQKREFLGDRQWAALEAALAPDGKFNDCRSIIVCSPVPFAFLSPAQTKAIGENVKAADDLLGLWTGNGVEELPLILDLLQRWKTSGPEGVAREVTIVAGDIHIGLQTDIYLEEDTSVVAFQQLTTSAVHNEPCASVVLKFMAATSGGFGSADTLCKGWDFQHSNWVHANNYGMVRVHAADPARPDLPPLVETSLIKDCRKAKGASEVFLEYNTNEHEKKKGKHGLAGFCGCLPSK